MASRICVVLMIMAGALSPLFFVGTSSAREGFWQGDVSTNWNTAGNWYVVGAPGDGGFVPQASGGFNVRAIIGTDSPNGALNTTSGNSPLIPGALPTAKQSIGGLYLGLRELDYTVNPPAFVNAEPAPGALVGSLTITDGTLNNVSTSEAGFGADGNIRVGVDGRGFLTMTGGTLSGQSLEVDGEEYSGDALGNSLVDLSGSATLNISNDSNASNGSADFNRRLRIEGPDVTVTTSGAVRFGSDSNFHAVITGPTTHAMIQSGGAAFMGGVLDVEFSGAGATHSVGDTWDLLDSAIGVSSADFSNLGAGGQITVSGLSSETPVGAAYYIRRSDGPGSHKLVQLSYEGVLVLNVNRDTGELKVTNPQGGAIEIDSYTVRSALGSMKNTFDGITTDTDWSSPGNHPVTGDPLNDANALTQWKQDGTYDVSGVGSSGISLGDGFDRQAVAGDLANFGADGEDLIFEYSSPYGGVARGQIVYEGAKFENNLVLRVNPNTGEATLINDSLETLHFDGYSVVSSTGALNGAGWTGLGGDWDQSPASSDSLSETNLTGSLTLSPGQEMAIGDISAADFTMQTDQDGLSMQFILSQGIDGAAAPVGDYNEDGAVDAADYTVWRDSLGQNITLPNESPDATTPGVVDQEDYDFWRSQYGSTGVALPETEFRVGSVLFDATLSSLGAAATAAPEPGAALLLLSGVGALLGVDRRRRRRSWSVATMENHGRQTGGITMTSQIWRQTPVLLAVLAAAMMASPVGATTQGISLTNYDFELPGPPNEKTIAFDETGAPRDNIPGWTFPGPGVENFGHEDHENGDELGDSGTEGGGNPGNEMFLSTFDGVSYQTSNHSVQSISSTQAYRLSFDAHNIYTVLTEGSPSYETPQNELTARLFYLEGNGTTRTTIGSPLVVSGLEDFVNYTIEIAGGSGDLTPAIGRPIGVEFDVTSDVYNPTWVQHSWIGVDNVLLQIAGVLPGDFDGDGDIDLDDYSVVRDQQQQSQLYSAQGEMTGDGLVDLNDFRAFKTAYDAQNGAGALTLALEAASVPEPSSLATVMLLATLATGFRRRRVLQRGRHLAVGLLLCMAAAPASADLVFYDPFLVGGNAGAGEYTVGSLDGQNPTLSSGTTPDFFTGAWTIRDGDSAPNGQVKDMPGLSYIGAPAEGGSAGAVEDPVTFEGSTRVGRYIKEEERWTDDTVGTYYLSWLQSFGSIEDPSYDMGFRAVEMWEADGTVGSDPTAVSFIGYNAYYSAFDEPLSSQQRAASTARMTFAFGEADSLEHQIIENAPANFMEDGGTHLIVLKFVLSDQEDSDTVSLFLDPTSLTEPNLPGASFSGQNVSLGAFGFSQFGGAGPTYNTIDEIRVADAWADALPPLPVPGDTDGDGDVDLDDYNNIVTHMNLSVGSALEGDVAKADGSQGSDGRVTIADFRLWKDNYPFPAPAGGLFGAQVPEPSGALMLLVATAFGVGRRRCRG